MGITQATYDDIPGLVALVNSAYRGEYSRKGWTTEADLLQGDLRIDIPVMTTQMNDPDAAILKYTGEDGIIKGCVYLKRKPVKVYLGMLTVEPMSQSMGIGKQLLAAAERYAVSHGYSIIQMTVISERKELIDWYNRHGYAYTGKTKPFPVNEQFGIPVKDLFFVVLEKHLQQRNPGQV